MRKETVFLFIVCYVAFHLSQLSLEDLGTHLERGKEILAGFLADPIGKASEFYDHLVETGAARILSFAVASKFISWHFKRCLLYTSPSPRDGLLSRMPSSA